MKFWYCDYRDRRHLAIELIDVTLLEETHD